MGYTTDFSGSFFIEPKVDDETAKLLKGLANTRRVARNIEGFGVEGEFYVDGKGYLGQDDTPDVIDNNRPPAPQPGLWCQWLLQDDNQTLSWDEGEKFYYYIEWLEYLIVSILKPRGYSVSGEVKWFGEDTSDLGLIRVLDNNVFISHGRISYV